jgi:hypothetical protein
VRKNQQLVKDAVVSVFGEPFKSSNRRYYNIIPLKTELERMLDEQPTQQQVQNIEQDENELPY